MSFSQFVFFSSSFKTFDCKYNEYLLVLYLGFSFCVIVFWVITEIRSICLFAFIFTSILLEETVVLLIREVIIWIGI